MDLHHRLEGGRLGVAALDTANGRLIGYDHDSRYAMCSTFKVALAAAVLHRAARGGMTLADPVPLAQSDLVPHAPVVERYVARGSASVEVLARAIVTVSDNAAANLLLARIGGPEGLTRFLRSVGDSVTRLDRIEPELNSNLEGDPRDTSTPAAMVRLHHALLLTGALPASARAQLVQWMIESQTGLQRLRAGLPAGWRAGDKTGTGRNGAVNDVAIAWPPGRSPILIACYMDRGAASLEQRSLIHAEVARRVVAALA